MMEQVEQPEVAPKVNKAEAVETEATLKKAEAVKTEAKPKKADQHAAFFDKYEKQTVGQVLTAAANGDSALRARILLHERQTKGRQAVVVPLVQWDK